MNEAMKQDIYRMKQIRGKKKKFKHKDIKLEIEKYLEKYPATCRICGSTYRLEFHHLVPKSKGNKDIRLNDYRNLILICHEHHQQIHTKRDLPEYYKYKFDFNMEGE